MTSMDHLGNNRAIHLVTSTRAMDKDKTIMELKETEYQLEKDVIGAHKTI
jgi:hypothetical protein